MEVFSIFFSDKILIDSLIDFFLKNSSITFLDRDHDTIYLESIEDTSNRLFVHFDTNFKEEMNLNFDKEDNILIEHLLGSEEIFMIDISYNDSTFLYKILSDFVRSLKSIYKDTAIPILFHDPFNGFVEIR